MGSSPGKRDGLLIEHAKQEAKWHTFKRTNYDILYTATSETSYNLGNQESAMCDFFFLIAGSCSRLQM